MSGNRQGGFVSWWQSVILKFGRVIHPKALEAVRADCRKLTDEEVLKTLTPLCKHFYELGKQAHLLEREYSELQWVDLFALGMVGIENKLKQEREAGK